MCNMPTLFLLMFPRTIIVNHMYTAVKNVVSNICLFLQLYFRRSERIREKVSVRKITGDLWHQGNNSRKRKSRTIM